jgi:hypothetical protein
MRFNKYRFELEKKQLNIYALTLIILFILSIIRNSVYKDYHTIIIYILLMHIYIIYYKLQYKNLLILIFIIGFTLFTLSYLASLYELDSVYFFFIGIEIALGAIYNFFRRKYIVLIIISVIPVFLFLNSVTDNRLFTNYINPEIRIHANSINWMIAAILIITKIYFGRTNRNLFSRSEQTGILNNESFKGLKDENIDNQKLELLIQIAYNNHSNFIIKFKEYYPVFTRKTELLIPNIVISEFEVIALLKLNFTTKEIARATNSSVRSIESKKYRIRKKLQIPSNMDMSLYFDKL